MELAIQNNEALLTVDEAAARLRVSRSRIFTYLREGRLKGVSLGYRSRRVLRSSVDAFIARLVQADESAAGPGEGSS